LSAMNTYISKKFQILSRSTSQRGSIVVGLIVCLFIFQLYGQRDTSGENTTFTADTLTKELDSTYTQGDLKPEKSDSLQADPAHKDSARKVHTEFDSTAFTDTAALSPDSLSDSSDVPFTNAHELSLDSVAIDSSDTLAFFWKKSYFSLGVSWSVGSIPLFSLWQSSLPSKLEHLGLTTDTVGGPTGEFENGDTLYDTLFTDFEEKEKPDFYNLAFPVHINWNFGVTDTRYFTLSGAFSFIRKTFKAAIVADTLGNQVKMVQSFAMYNGALELILHGTIPEEYFSITGIERTSFTLGVGTSPYIYLKRKSRVYREGGGRGDNLQSPLDSVLALQAQKIRPLFDNFTASGFSITWKAGITTLKKSTPYSGIEAGLYYSGQFYVFPDITENDIRSVLEEPDNTDLSFISHRLVIRVALLRTRKKRE